MWYVYVYRSHQVQSTYESPTRKMLEFMQVVLENESITEEVFRASSHLLWFQLLETNQEAAAKMILELLLRYPTLCFAVDERGRKALTVAETSSEDNYKVLKSQTLWHGITTSVILTTINTLLLLLLFL